jgi:hypothetical protein
MRSVSRPSAPFARRSSSNARPMSGTNSNSPSAPRFMLLLPGAIGTITDPKFGNAIRPHHRDIEENEDGDFTVTAEEYADRSARLARTARRIRRTIRSTPTSRLGRSIRRSSSSRPSARRLGRPKSGWPSAAAMAPTADPNWGGCYVWLSTDNVTYQQVGQIDTPARMGKLTGSLASYGGANPDTTHSLPGQSGDERGRSHWRHGGRCRRGDHAEHHQGRGRNRRIPELSRRDAHRDLSYTLGGQLYRGSTARAPDRACERRELRQAR